MPARACITAAVLSHPAGGAQDADIKQRFGFLYGGYSFQYWETVDMLRKLVLGGIPVFIAVQPEGSLQAVLGEIVLVGTMAAQLYIMPFIDFTENCISIASMAGAALGCFVKASCAHAWLPTPHGACAVLWLVLLTGEVAKWGHLSAVQTTGIAALQLALTSGVAAVVAFIITIAVIRKLREV
jgi:hypothetical protein